jgi:uncharacterized DUF497 family protein
MQYSSSLGTPKEKKERPVRIDELVWDEWNEEHIGRHGVQPEEVEDAVFDDGSVFLKTTREGQLRYLVLGLSEDGRYLFVVLEPLSGARAYVVTARDDRRREAKIQEEVRDGRTRAAIQE